MDLQMSRTVYVNGEYLAESQARISVFDRGFLFGDAIYEVSAVLEGRLVDNAAHLARLHRSLDALGMPAPASDDALMKLRRLTKCCSGVISDGLMSSGRLISTVNLPQFFARLK